MINSMINRVLTFLYYKWLLYKHKDSNFVKHAEHELKLAGLYDKDSDYGGMLAEDAMRLVLVFAEEGHSGFSAGLATSIFNKLSKYEPLTPLTGKDEEWAEVENNMYQNKRCSYIFKENGIAYNSQGKVFRNEHGSYTSIGRVNINFPYTPVTEYVDIKE
jgi:hypothetical protein